MELKNKLGLVHTPGPWKISDARSTLVYLIDDQDKQAVGEAVFVDVRNPADASLIAVSPEMLQQLTQAFEESEKALRLCGMPMISWEWHAKTQAVLMRAVGHLHA